MPLDYLGKKLKLFTTPTHMQAPATFMAKLQSLLDFPPSLWYMNQSMSTKINPRTHNNRKQQSSVPNPPFDNKQYQRK